MVLVCIHRNDFKLKVCPKGGWGMLTILLRLRVIWRGVTEILHIPAVLITRTIKKTLMHTPTHAAAAPVVCWSNTSHAFHGMNFANDLLQERSS